jgi:L-rhamnose mutarotase
MIIDTPYSFSFERKAMLDGCNPKVQEWENLMNKYQQSVPGTKPGDKWAVAIKYLNSNS